VTAALKTYNWPGNVRELENAIEYASILAGKDKIRMEHLPSSISQRMAESPGQARPPEWPSLQELEREYIFRVLEFCGGKKGRAAKMLGVGANTLWRKLKQ
jgi:DNA-binding NtrC family response regulator